jgi:elongation factor G
VREKMLRLLEVAIQPKSAADAGKLITALEQLVADDEHLGMTTDAESGLTILQGTSEALLEEKLAHIDVPFNVGALQVAYREILTKPVTIRYVHKRQTGGTGQFALVEIDFEPQGADSGFAIENAITNGSIPPEFIPAIKKGLSAQSESGVLAGFPLTDFKATLTGGAYHELDSSELAFNIAARCAVREITKYDAVRLAEPIMRVGVVTPDYFLGGVIGDLNSRRGQVQEVANSQFYQLISALVPLANMFGYHRTLRSMCQGRAQYVMEFDHYESVPDPGGDDPQFPGAMAMRIA